MNVKQIIVKYLEEIGADGLCSENCGCGIEEIIPCDEDSSNCVPAKLAKCTDECQHDCAGERVQCFQPFKEN